MDKNSLSHTPWNWKRDEYSDGAKSLSQNLNHVLKLAFQIGRRNNKHFWQ